MPRNRIQGRYLLPLYLALYLPSSREVARKVSDGGEGQGEEVRLIGGVRDKATNPGEGGG